MRQQLRHQVCIVLAAAVVFFTNLGTARLWDMDEALHASCAREMFQRGDWVVPTFNGDWFFDKPPLMFWCMISGFELFGVTEFAARFWSAVLGIGTALFTYHLGRLLFRAEVGFWAGLVTASTIIFTVSARAATVDSALVFLTTGAILAFVAGGLGRQAMAAGHRAEIDVSKAARPALLPPSWIVFVLIYACLGVAVLAKGPIGVILPVAMLGLFLAIMNCRQPRQSQPSSSAGEKTARLRAAMRISPLSLWERVRVRASDSKAIYYSATSALPPSPPAPLPQAGEGRFSRQALRAVLRPFGPLNLCRAAWQMRPLTATLVVLAVAAPWYVLVGLRTDGVWLDEFFGKHNLQRALQPFETHSGPIYYYLLAILVGFFPWSVFLGPSLANMVQRLRQDHAWTPGYILVACWIGLFVAFWSLIKTKLPHYVLPAYPALALLTGCFVDRWLTEPAGLKRWWLRNAWISMVLVGAGMIVALPIVAAQFLPGEAILGLVGLIPLAGGAWCWRQTARNRHREAAIAFAVASVAFLTVLFGFAALRVDRHQNAVAMLAEIAQNGPAAPDLMTYRFRRESFVFYAGQVIPHCRDAAQLSALLERSKHPCIITGSEHEEEIDRVFAGEFSVLARQPKFLRRGDVVVLVRRAAPDAARTTACPQPDVKR